MCSSDLQGLGLGLLETVYPYYPSPDHRGSGYGSYFVPAMEELPELECIILENPSADGPFGAKAIGEMANNAQPPAIATAIYDAVGVWVTEMPITPEKVLRALQAKAAGTPESREDGKHLRYDEELSINAIGSGHVRFDP